MQGRHRRTKGGRAVWLLTTLALMIVATVGHRMNAQTTYGILLGTARDPSGSVVPNVQVTVTDQNSGRAYTSETNSLGSYHFTTLFPGVYNISAVASGFRPIEIRGIVLQVNQTARFDLDLQVGEKTDTVDVQATAPVLATEKSDVGQVIDNREIVNLPLNGRNFMQLASLTNGVILTTTNTESGGPNFLSMGGRPTQNSFLVEGVETRIQREGGYGLNLSIDAIQEFKVMQNAFSAEYGRATTIINAAIKSGGNTVHGSLFEFLRNDKLDARNAFDLTGEKPPLRFNQFGGSVGGPIRRDKLFYFVNYEGQRIRRSLTTFTNVPTPAMLSGDLSGQNAVIDPATGEAFPDNRIPDSSISQFARAGNAYYPAPNSAALANANYVAVLPNPTEMDQVSTRIDANLGAKDRLNGSLTFFQFDQTNTGTLPFSGFKSFSKVRPMLSLQHTHTFSANLLNDFRFGYSRTRTFVGADQLLDEPVLDEFGIRNLSPEPVAFAPPGIDITGFGYTGHQQWIPNGATDTVQQVAEGLTYIAGKSTWKFGTDLRWLGYNDLGYAIQNGAYGFNGQYTGSSVGDYLLGLPSYAFSHQAGGSGFTERLRNGEFSFYAQDDIKITPSLTLNAGLRYEYVQYPLEVNNELATWNFQKGTLDFAGSDIPRKNSRPQDTNNWGPRLGLAYTPSVPRKKR